MADPVAYQNRPGGHVWFSLNAANTITLTSASVNTSIETVSNLAITKVFWTGSWTISRGSNTVLYLGNTGPGFFDFNGQGTSLSQFSTATVVCANNDTNGTLLIQLAKQTAQAGGGAYGSDGTHYTGSYAPVNVT
jgi:hypothetical protein